MKFLAYGWSSRRSAPALRDQAEAALASACRTGWDGLLADQRDYLDDFWERADVEIDGDAELQQAVRFALFHVLQAGARAERRAIPAKGLTGGGYDGHTFWDMEIFVLPVADLHGARRRGRRAALAPLDARPRRRRAPMSSASRAPRSRGGRSAARSARATGPPAPPRSTSTPTSPTPSAATSRSPSDEASTRGPGARAARRDRAAVALGRPPRRRRARFRIDGVTGPDEYSRSPTTTSTRTSWRRGTSGAAADAVGSATRDARGRARRRRRGGRDLARRRRRDASSPSTRSSACTRSPRASRATAAGTSRHRAGRATRCCCTSRTSLLYRSQVVKQADLVLALTCAATPSPPSRRRATSPTTRRSPCATRRCRRAIQAIVAAEVGHLDLAYDYFGRERRSSTCTTWRTTPTDGVHLASLAGTWLAAVAGFGGMRDHGDGLAFAPRLPGAARPDRVPAALPRPAAARRDRPAARRATSSSRARRCRSTTTATGARAGPAGDAPSPPPLTPEPAQQPPGREPRPRARRARQRRSRRMTSRRPDQVASMAATFVSTSPRGSAISRTTSSVTSVGTPEARLGQQTHSIPGGARRGWSVAMRLASSRRSVTKSRTMSSGFGRALEPGDAVEVAQQIGQLRRRRVDVGAHPGLEAELLRQRRAAVARLTHDRPRKGERREPSLAPF